MIQDDFLLNPCTMILFTNCERSFMTRLLPVLVNLLITSLFLANITDSLHAESGKISDEVGNRIVLKLPPSKGNPRNSEGDFIRLKDGRIMFIYTYFYGGHEDYSTAHLVARYSSDEGKTWTEKDEMVVENEGDCNVMSVSLLRLQTGEIALFYLRKNGWTDCRPLLRISKDEGKTWSDATECIPDEVMYVVVNNDRIIQLKNGRVLMPMAKHQEPGQETDWLGELFCYYSDDNCKTWKRSKSQFKLFDENGKRLTAQEPGVIELNDGRIMMYIRSDAGCQMVCYSSDGGDTWTKPDRSEMSSPLSPASIERIPGTNDLLLVWNNHDGIPDDLKGKRTPLTVAVSKDEGQTWTHVKNLQTLPSGWYCYTAIEFVDGHVLLGHCAGDRKKNNGLAETHITRVNLDWIYQ